MGDQVIDSWLYPATAPYKTDYLNVNGHQIYFELSGNPDGPTALFLHGGPGGGTSARDRRFFNPEHYRVVLMDQRGSGKSIPNACNDYEAALFNNSTQYLIEDIEQLREELSLKLLLEPDVPTIRIRANIFWCVAGSHEKAGRNLELRT